MINSSKNEKNDERRIVGETDYVTERFAYDHEGREVASTNALGGVVTTSYDPRGNVTAVDGATYPLRMEYDLKGRRTSLKTTRDGESWDETRWALDPPRASAFPRPTPTTRRSPTPTPRTASPPAPHGRMEGGTS